MKVKRILALVLTAAMLLTACGKQSEVSQLESSTNSVLKTSSEPISSEAEPSSESSTDTAAPDDGIVRYPVTASEADGINCPELVCLLLPEGEYVQQFYETTDGNYILSVSAADEDNRLRVVSKEGELLKEIPLPFWGWLFQNEDIFILDGTDESVYYDRMLNEIEQPDSESGSYPYTLDYSEDGKYLQLIAPDGSRTNLAETGAESYQDVYDGVAGFYGGRAGLWESYSDGGMTSGLVNRETGEIYTFDERSGVRVYEDAGEYLICTSQGQEGGMYPAQPYIYQFYPGTGELKELALPYRSWPVMFHGNYFAYDLYFGYDEEEDIRMKTDLMELVPGLTEEQLDVDSVTFVVDGNTLQIVRYYADEIPFGVTLQSISPDWTCMYYSGSYDTEDEYSPKDIRRPRVYRLPFIDVEVCGYPKA